MRISRIRQGSRVGLAVMFITLPSLVLADQNAVGRVVQAGFARVNRTSEIPASVTAALIEMLGGEKLADPPYLRKAAEARTETCHLLFAGRSPSVWLVHFSCGATPVRYDLAVFELQADGNAITLGRFASAARAWSVPNLKNMIRRGDFREVERP